MTQVSYRYDEGTNGLGHLTGQAGPATYSYDVLGRMMSEGRTIAGVTKNMSYTYNLDGSVATMTYPSGAAITYIPDSAGRILSAVDTTNSSQPMNYVTGATYNAPGLLTASTYGQTASFTGILNTFSFNSRLQPVNLWSSSPTRTLMNLIYDFHAGNGNNGNVYAITNNRDTNRSQAFTYDALNRLLSAQNAGTDCSQKLPDGHTEYWGNSYVYDPWGNLNQKVVTKCTAESLSVAVNASNQLQGYSYDAAGNMTRDNNGMNYVYDAENRISSTSGFSYLYDADGNRVQKTNGNTSPATGTLYWSMSPGIVAESDLLGNLQSEYVFFDGERVARKDFHGNAVSYYFSDHLKTASVITDAVGSIKSESDYYPWGGELQFSNGDSNHYKFTGKERDSESGLDYFGARYYGNALGRFTSIDPKMISKQRMADPQQWNMYQYSRNNPIVNVDPDGRETTIFYRAPGAGGSSAGDFGHIFIHVRNGETGKSAYFDYYPGNKPNTSVIGHVDQSRLDAHSRLTIQTTPQQEQKMLDALGAKQNDVPKYDASPSKILTGTESTCVTQSENILSAGGLNISGTTPTEAWQSAYSQFSSEGLDWKDQTTAGFAQSPFYNPGTPPQGPGYDNAQPGQEYGRDPSGTAGKVDPNATKNENIIRKDEPK